MPSSKIHQTVAEAFHAEGVRCIFGLTGDGNMHWEASMAALPGMSSYHVRHEHAAVAMASAHAVGSGDVGVASVTCGPGLTQIMTALSTAAQARIPLVVLAGEDPISATWYNQRIDQAPFVTACGGIYIAARSAAVVRQSVQEAFILARSQRLPVVLGLPLDLQQEVAPPGEYTPSRQALPAALPRAPHPGEIAAAVSRIVAARRVMLVCGRGAMSPEARAAAVRLAEMVDGGLTVTLPVRGLFNGHPRDLGITGGFAHEVTREAFAEADLVIAVGTSLTRHSSDLNTLFRPEQVLQIDTAPGLRQGQVPSGSRVVADAGLALEAICAALEAGSSRPATGWDIAALSQRILNEPADTLDWPAEEGRLDPREVVRVLDRHLPKSWAQVNSAGHSSYFAAHMYGRDAEDFLTIREFGAIGNGPAYAMGRHALRPEQPVFLIEGDGGFLMHVQELETVRRCGMKILMIILNDGAYGSEIHKLRADGVSDRGAVFGFGDIAAIARGFGLAGHVVTDTAQIPDLARAFAEGEGAALWDIRISDRVMAPTMRRTTRRG